MNEDVKWYVIITENREVIVYQWGLDYQSLEMSLSSPNMHGKDQWRLYYYSEFEENAKAKAYDVIEAFRVLSDLEAGKETRNNALGLAED